MKVVKIVARKNEKFIVKLDWKSVDISSNDYAINSCKIPTNG